MAIYGIDSGQLGALEAEEEYFVVSTSWHDLLGIRYGAPVRTPRPVPEVAASEVAAIAVPAPRPAPLPPRLREPAPLVGAVAASIDVADICNVLKQLHGTGFRPPTFVVLQALSAQLQGSGGDMLLVAPTGSGKSDAIYGPCLHGPVAEQVSVLVVPFKALVRQVLERAAQLGVPAAAWEPARDDLGQRLDPNLRLLVVIPESATSRSLSTVLSDLHQAGRLARLVVDEVHVAGPSVQVA